MDWFYLLMAGALEIVWALGLKYSDGFTRPWPSVTTLAAMALSYVLLALSLRSVPFGTAYAIWAGLGAAGVIAVGILLFEDPADWTRMGCLALIVVGTIGLRLATPA